MLQGAVGAIEVEIEPPSQDEPNRHGQKARPGQPIATPYLPAEHQAHDERRAAQQQHRLLAGEEEQTEDQPEVTRRRQRRAAQCKQPDDPARRPDGEASQERLRPHEGKCLVVDGQHAKEADRRGLQHPAVGPDEVAEAKKPKGE